MKKIFLKAAVFACFWTFESKAQQTRKLTFEEANFVSSYYQQSGNNAAVTGGLGSEKLSDWGGSFNVKFSLFDKKNRQHSFLADISAEKYTSASSDKIDPTTLSSASYSDVHIYPSLTWSRKNETTGNTLGLTANYSHEFDYQSWGGGLFYTKTSADKNTEVTAKLNTYFDQIKVILPAELRPPGYPTGSEDDSDGIPYKPRNTYNASISISQVINPGLQLLLMLDPAYQEGLLSTPFHRVYFNDGGLKVEKLPGERFKLPASIRANYFVDEKLILRSFYRFYYDNWGLIAHTANLETVLKINPFFSITPHYRFSKQNGIDYFSPYGLQNPNAEFYSSDYDLSKFDSHFLGVGFRTSTPGGVMGIKGFNALEIRYGFYHRNTGLEAHIVSLSLQIK